MPWSSKKALEERLEAQQELVQATHETHILAQARYLHGLETVT